MFNYKHLRYIILTYTDQPMLDLYGACYKEILVKLTAKSNEHTRREAAIKLFNNGCVSLDIPNSAFFVNSETRSGVRYNIFWDKLLEKWMCTCPDHTYHNNECKHIMAVDIALKASEEFADTIKTAENIKRKLVARPPIEIETDAEREFSP